MGLFEQHPWMLIPLVIAVSEGWSALKRLVIQTWGIRRDSSKAFR
ncbi:MAG: hypothetical protein ACXV5J_09195 [Candidatus Angelobacter sp.]